MPDQPAPDYVPRPNGSGTGATVAVVILFVLLCGVCVLGLRFFKSSAAATFPATATRVQTMPSQPTTTVTPEQATEPETSTTQPAAETQPPQQ